MKRLSQLVIRTFIGPFFLTFILILFILLMQFVWKYLDDLMGKGLEWHIVAELLIFQSTNLVPLALPLSILLASIMTFGNLAEHFELVALKSSGNSLLRVMRPLTMLVMLLSVGAFFFSNRVVPYANLKARSLLYDIVQQKPMLELNEGVFYNGMEGFRIRVGEKDKERDLMRDILIYDHRNKAKGNATVIRAKEGRMSKTPSGRFMILELVDGVSYDEQGLDTKRDPSAPHVRSHFARMDMRFDLSSFEFKESDEEKWTNNIPMQDMSQLRTTADSLKVLVNKRKKGIEDYVQKVLTITRDSLTIDSIPVCDVGYELSAMDDGSRNRVFKVAYNMANNTQSYLKSAQKDLVNRRNFVNRHWNEWHRKLTLSAACLVLFFIGAPLGGIIKKGGLGMPVLFSILFFLIFHVSSITGEKMAKTGALDPWEGMWLSTGILLPIALLLTYRANTDTSSELGSGIRRIWGRMLRRDR